MIDLWLRSGTAGIILIPFLLLFAIAAGIVWLTHLSPARAYFASCVGIVGPFFGSAAAVQPVRRLSGQRRAAPGHGGAGGGRSRGRRHPHRPAAVRGAR